MVFESLVSQLLNSVLGDFVENLDSTQLNLGIWGGDIELKDLVLKQTALEDLDLPIQTVYGKIGKLVLKIPWKSLYSSPTVVSLEDIYLLAEPNKQVKYDAQKESKYILEAKRKAIQKVEAAKKAEQEKDQPKDDPTLAQRIKQQIIKNIQLHIGNIHIRYEDKITNPGLPFALGVTLSSLTVESTDAEWNRAITDDVSKIYKIVALEGLAVYWNCATKLYGSMKNTENLITCLKKDIASKNQSIKNYHYILGPISASARLRMNPKPEDDEKPYTIPLNHFNLDMGLLFVGISKAQYRDIIALADSMDRMSKGLPYRKFRPHVDSYLGHAKEWWQFAYTCALEDVRRRKRDWQWENMLQHRKMGREYGQLYKKKLQKTAANVDLERIEECEKKLDLTSIVIIRRRVELETEKLEKMKKKTEKKGWFGGWWGSGASKEDLDDLKGKAAIREPRKSVVDRMYAYMWGPADGSEQTGSQQTSSGQYSPVQSVSGQESSSKRAEDRHLIASQLTEPRPSMLSRAYNYIWGKESGSEQGSSIQSSLEEEVSEFPKRRSVFKPKPNSSERNNAEHVRFAPSNSEQEINSELLQERDTNSETAELQSVSQPSIFRRFYNYIRRMVGRSIQNDTEPNISEQAGCDPNSSEQDRSEQNSFEMNISDSGTFEPSSSQQNCNLTSSEQNKPDQNMSDLNISKRSRSDSNVSELNWSNRNSSEQNKSDAKRSEQDISSESMEAIKIRLKSARLNFMLSQFEKEMTPEEKAKLYQAIDYHENAAPTEYPEHFVDNSLTFLLRSLKVVLTDDDHTYKTIVSTVLTDVRVKLETRTAASAMKVNVKVDNYKSTGLKHPDEEFLPILIQPEQAEKHSLLDVMFETNPLDKECDKRLHVVARPLFFIYDALTINKAMDIFTVPPDASLDQLSAVAGDKLTNVKQMTATGLQYTIEKHVKLDVNIDLHAPYVILPYGGRFREMENVLVVNLGRVKIYSVGHKISLVEVKHLYEEGKTQDEIFEQILTHSYDRFVLDLSRLQIVVAQSEENWRQALEQAKPSPVHILNPLTLKVTYAKSLISDDPRIPWSKVNAELPNIDISISDSRLMLLLALLTSIPLPNADSTSSSPLLAQRDKFGGSTTSIMLKSLQDDKKAATDALAILPRDTNRSEYTQFVTLEAVFEMAEFRITLSQQDTLESPKSDLAMFKINSIQGEFSQRTFDMNVKLSLDSVTLTHTRKGNVIEIISTPISKKGKECLFKVDYTKVDPQSPDIHSIYKSCETSLLLNFSKLRFILHQEGLLTLMAFANSVQENVSDLTSPNTLGAASSMRITRTLSTISESMSEKQQPVKKLKQTSVEVVVATIKFRVMASLEELSMLFCTDHNEIASVAIRGINADVIMKTTYTQVTAKLRDLAIIDMNPETAHNMIFTCVEDNAFTTQIVINNLGEEESDKPDMVIMVRIGGARVIFLNWFVTNMLGFLNQFQAAQQAILDASEAAAKKAKENVVDVYEKATKVSINIRLRAPDVIVPVDSQSYDTLFLSLGVISITNTFLTLDIKNQEKHAAVIDEMKIQLTDLKLSRVILSKSYEIVEECNILEPITFNIKLKRNLSVSWYNSIPDIDVSGSLETINLILSQDDYKMMMSILKGNLTEGQVDTPVEQKPSNKIAAVSAVSIKTRSAMTVERPTAAVVEESTEEEKKVHIFLKFTFTMDNFVINLYTGSSEVNATTRRRGSIIRTADSHLGRFGLEGLSLKGRILSDNSIVTSVLLSNCLLDDMRKGREDKLNRFIEKKNLVGDISAARHSVVSENVAATPKSMLDVTYQQKEQDKFLDARVYSFTLILSVEYMVKLAEFFNMPDETQSDLNVTKNAVPGATSTVSATTSASLAKPGRSNTRFDEEQKDPNAQMTINLKIEQPDIVLVDHMENIDTSAMILNSEIVLKYRMIGEHQVVNGIIRDLQLYTCTYNPAKRADTRYSVLHPVTISLAGSTPEGKGLHLELIVGNILVSVSPGTIELLNRVSASFSSSTSDEEDTKEETFNFKEIWEPTKFKNNDYWFLRMDSAVEATEEVLPETEKPSLQELCIVSMRSIIMTVEAGVGNKTLPMIMFETTLMGNVKNWSSQMSVDAVLTMQMGYYNSSLALWEPLIEPTEEVIDNKVVIKPWELKVDVSMSDLEDVTSPSSETEVEPATQPVMSIDLTSDKTLELTVTKTCLEMLDTLSKAFASAMDLKQTQIQHGHQAQTSYKVLNDIGEDITLLLEKSSFTVGVGADPNDVNRSAAVPIQLRPELIETKTVRLRKNLNSRSISETLYLYVKINSKNCELALPLVKADKRYFMINYRSDTNDSWGVISDVRVDEGVTVLTLRSILQVHNHFSIPIEVYYMTVKGNELELVGTVEGGSTLNLPLKAVYNPTNELFFAVEGYSVTKSPYVWKNLQTSLTSVKMLECPVRGSSRGRRPFIIKAIGEMEQVYYENTTRHTMASTCYNIHLRPAVILKNFLPITIVSCVDELAEEVNIAAGDTLRLPNANPGKSVLVLRIPDYLEKEWSCRENIDLQVEEFSVWTFHSYDSPTKMSLDLGIHTIDKDGSLILSLYCPFWMLNKTDLMLGYRGSDENLNTLHHPANFKGPILFSFNAKNFFGKKKASLNVESGEWSNKFSLDVAGSSGVVSCKSNDRVYQIGVHNQLTYNTLTKQVTFTPYYIIINEAPFAIECQESDRPADAWLTVAPKSCSALWPRSELEDKLLKVRVAGTREISAPFLYTESHTTLLRLNNKYGGINVDLQLTEGAVYINLAPYTPGSAPALIINHTSYPIHFWEKYSVQIRTLKPKNCVLYTWENPAGPRTIIWENTKKVEFENDLRKDGGGTFTLDEETISWSSFLDGMQRILLFSEDCQIAETVLNIFEVIQREITLSLHGVGLSLVNNQYRQEIMYVGIASSGIIWEARKLNRKRFKPLSLKDSTHIEIAYQEYLRKKEMSDEDLLSCPSRTVVDNKFELDFGLMQLFKPHKRILRRTFQTGAWLQMKTSPNQTQMHIKINRLQIDNQMYDCIFPVVLAPVPPPKSVAIDSGIKPFVEISIVQLMMKNSQIIQYKYYKILVQEFHIKVDLGFLNAIYELMQQAENTDDQDRELFITDMKLVDEALYSVASGIAAKEQKSFYDQLHFSPLKIHVSFSMAAGTSAGQSATTPNFLNVLLQGVGVTLTDLQDVVFKLAFFERNYTFLTQRQLISEASSHYVGQLVKQLYVLVLGLDVIGNPYGLVVGITKGVEDLFYEPFQGAIQGPSEFAEGLALGVCSLFGHTVGGALGAATRITGAVGKGIAALTFDEDFQRKRRDQINKKPATVHEGLARSGKGLVMGVFDGVTGVFTKPVSGAREHGVEGFFKGLGKGAVGLVARPAAGVIDFASGSLDAVKRATETHEEIIRLRPPRFMQSDGLVRPYNRTEAEGSKILSELSKGKYATTDSYVFHYEVIPRKEILLLTDKRIAYLTTNDIFGGWQVDWSYTWQDLKHPASVTPKGVAISLQDVKKKRLFSSSESTKIILINDPALKEEICSKIESLRSN